MSWAKRFRKGIENKESSSLAERPPRNCFFSYSRLGNRGRFFTCSLLVFSKNAPVQKHGKGKRQTNSCEYPDRRISPELDVEQAGQPRTERVCRIHRGVGEAGNRPADRGVQLSKSPHDKRENDPKRRKNDQVEDGNDR